MYKWETKFGVPQTKLQEELNQLEAQGFQVNEVACTDTTGTPKYRILAKRLDPVQYVRHQYQEKGAVDREMATLQAEIEKTQKKEGHANKEKDVQTHTA